MNIRTKWHRVRETIGVETWEQDRISINGGEGRVLHTAKERAALVHLAGIVDNLPKYHISDELVAMMDDDGVLASIRALVEAEVCRLPFPTMLVEFFWSGRHHLVVLSERGEDAQMESGDDQSLPFLAVPMWWSEQEGLTLSASYVAMGLELREEGVWYQFSGRMAPYTPESLAWVASDEKIGNRSVSTAVMALGAALLLLNTRGVAREVVETGRLNKHRVRSGKVPIPAHTVVRVGHVYSRGGRQVMVGAEGHRTMPIHWRRAHTRQQRIGPRSTHQTKLVYIPPILVNYTGEGEIHTRTPEVEVRW